MDLAWATTDDILNELRLRQMRFVFAGIENSNDPRCSRVFCAGQGMGREDLLELTRELRALLLRDGADAAVSESEAEGISTGWIDLGWVEAGDLDPQLELALEGLGPGDVVRGFRIAGCLEYS